MKHHYFFESGLPRCGSTLLSSILNQNPDIHCGTISPVVEIMYNTQKFLCEESEQYHSYPKPESAYNVISGVIENWYFDIQEPYICEKNRAWPNNIERIKTYITPNPKIICPVRDVLEILTSFIDLIHRNHQSISFIDEKLISDGKELTDDNRCDYLMSPIGIVDQSLYAMSRAWVKNDLQHIHIVEYNDLVADPEETIRKMYDFLEIPFYQHTFDNLYNKFREKDIEEYGLPDFHYVRKTLSKKSKNPKDVLSSYIIEKYSGLEFWKNSSSPYLSMK